MEVTRSASVQVGDGAVGKAYSSGYPVWSSVKDLIYDNSRKATFDNCEIETAFAVPIYSAGDSCPSCVLSCYSLLPVESVPFVLNFVQKAVRLLWSGLDQVVNPHESVGKELWKDVGPADLGEMAADVEMQKAFIGKKRPHSDISSPQPATTRLAAPPAAPRLSASWNDTGRLSFQENEVVASSSGNQRVDGSLSLLGTSPMDNLPSLAPAPTISPYLNTPINAPPLGKGIAPPPAFPNTVQDRSPNAQQFVFLDSTLNDGVGHWAVQQAVQSVGDVQLWNGVSRRASTGATLQPGGQFDNFGVAPTHQQQQQFQQPQHNLQPLQPPTIQHQPAQYQQQQQPQPQRYQMSYVNYQPNNAVQQQPPPSVAAYPPPGVHTDDPDTIHANLMEFNAMAAAAAPAVATRPPIQTNQVMPNHHYQQQQPPMSIPTSHAPQQQQSIMYCTSTTPRAPPSHRGTSNMNPNIYPVDSKVS